jgi:hypothetical protein
MSYFGASLPAALVMLVAGRRRPDAVPILVPLTLAAIYFFWLLPASFFGLERFQPHWSADDWFGTFVWFMLSGVTLTALCAAFSVVRYCMTRRRQFLAMAFIDALSLIGIVAGGFFLGRWEN